MEYHIYSSIVNLLTVYTLLASASWYDSGFTIWDVAQGIILKIMLCLSTVHDALVSAKDILILKLY